MPWPSTGIATASPMNNGNAPRISKAATIAPQVATAAGFVQLSRSEVATAGTQSDVAIEHQRERDDGDAKHEGRKQKPDPAANPDQQPAALGRRHVLEEVEGGSRRRGSVKPDIEPLRHGDPGGEDHDQGEPQGGQRRQGRRIGDDERVGEADLHSRSRRRLSS